MLKVVMENVAFFIDEKQSQFLHSIRDGSGLMLYIACLVHKSLKLKGKL